MTSATFFSDIKTFHVKAPLGVSLSRLEPVKQSYDTHFLTPRHLVGNVKCVNMRYNAGENAEKIVLSLVALVMKFVMRFTRVPAASPLSIRNVVKSSSGALVSSYA